jgi:transposase-like protein
MITEINQSFALLNTEEACAEYLFQLKWPAGFSCPSCSFRHAYKITSRRLPLYECSRCRHQTSIISGTVMQGSRTALSKWFLAIKLISDPSQGISALTLSQIIAVTYKTAWTLLHKIRFAMGKTVAEDPLSGNVILNDACYGRPYNPSVDLHPQETPVLIGSSLTTGEPSKIVIRAVAPEHISGNQINRSAAAAFIDQHVSPNASITDIQIKRYSPRLLKKSLPLFRVAHQWINSTFHGLGKKHLQTYFNEFSCRTNLQLASAPIFDGVSRICATNPTIIYASIIRNTSSNSRFLKSRTKFIPHLFRPALKVV